MIFIIAFDRLELIREYKMLVLARTKAYEGIHRVYRSIDNIIIIYSLLSKQKRINKQKYGRKNVYETIPKSTWYKN